MPLRLIVVARFTETLLLSNASQGSIATVYALGER